MLAAPLLGGCIVTRTVVHDLALEGVRLPTREERARIREDPMSRSWDSGVIVLLSTRRDLRQETARRNSGFQMTVALCEGRVHLPDTGTRGPFLYNAGLWDAAGRLGVSATQDDVAPAPGGRYVYWLPLSMRTRANVSYDRTGTVTSFFPDHDLRQDGGDICVYGRGARMLGVIWLTNTVVIPDAAIRAALGQPVPR
ncbi:MAG TPA: hypothetical protein VD970_08730 [Acetobacteraceae bacterium]|nr:hypothetical protein [Acetobacteraceae bacterium]